MWQSELVRIVRGLINDLDSPYTYDDSRLEETILISAQLITQELDFSVAYTVDVDQMVLTPDPTTPSKDNAFINLACLKTACMIDHWTLRGNARKAVRVWDGKSQIDMTKIVDAQKLLIEVGPCKAYSDAKLDYQMGASSPGEAILGPFSSPNFLYYNYGGVYSHMRSPFG